MLFVKFMVLLLLGFVIVSLFTGLYFLVKDNALSVRIGLSILAIVIVVIAGATGIIDINPSPLSGATSPGNAGNERIRSTLESEEPAPGYSGRKRIEE